MYVLSFRMRALLDDTHEREALRRLRINDFVKHILNPFKVTDISGCKFILKVVNLKCIGLMYV